jgi:hypothetical protein
LSEAPVVRHLRQARLWPVRLIPPHAGDDSEKRRAPWQLLREMGEASPWREGVDEYTGDANGFHERLGLWTKVRAFAAVWRREGG